MIGVFERADVSKTITIPIDINGGGKTMRHVIFYIIYDIGPGIINVTRCFSIGLLSTIRVTLS